MTMVLTSERIEVASLEGFQQHALEQAWHDGLPLVPPTEDRVQRMLEHCVRPADESLGAVAPYYGLATIEKLAIIAVMAGCRPAYFPILLTAVQAVIKPEFNLYGIQATTSPVAPLILVSGPIAEQVGMNAGDNAFGQGNVANATIGRALRLVLIILGGGTIVPQVDRATHGFPAKYSFCASENVAATPWQPFAVRRGLEPATSAVSVFGVHGFHSMIDMVSSTAEELMPSLSAGVAASGTNNMTHGGEGLLVLSPEHAEIIHGSGWTIRDVQNYLFEHARIDMTRLAPALRTYLRTRRPKWVDQDRYPVTDSPDDYQVIVVGGTGIHSVFLPSFGSTRAVTLPVLDVERSTGS
ncbi:hypothetical protein [Pseudonocardia sp. GCM10023141]|uniref:hypothetical protein n=1 Tax=Pseudonocardia sp. GCM10023141 TaxID=3252653 RepID=UPI0036063E0B